MAFRSISKILTNVRVLKNSKVARGLSSAALIKDAQGWLDEAGLDQVRLEMDGRDLSIICPNSILAQEIKLKKKSLLGYLKIRGHDAAFLFDDIRVRVGC